MAYQPIPESDLRVSIDPAVKQRAIDAAVTCSGSLREVVEAVLAQGNLADAVYRYRESRAREARREAQ